MTPDSELLRRYAESQSEEAFAELVSRHVNLVYSTALRRLNGDTHQAQDATQSVFADMARKASALSRRASLTGWIYTSAHFAARDMVRKDGRRRKREETFMSQPPHEPAPDTDWENLRPILDDVMHQLKEADREAILLRYFENRPLAEVGAKLGLTENTARMRVERALEKLRGILARRGIATTSSLLAAITANAIHVAPAGVAASLSAGSMAATTGGTFTILKIMSAAKLKLALGTLTVIGATTAIVLQYQSQTRLRAENQSLRNQMLQLQSNYENTSNQMATAREAKIPTGQQLTEVARLRAEVDRLRRKTNELARLQNANNHVASNTDSPDAGDSPEEQQKRASIAKMQDVRLLVLGEIMFAQQNQGQLATNFDQIGSYLTNASESLTGTNQFELVYHGSLNDLTNPASTLLMRESQPWPTIAGKWARSYAFGDGHSEVHVEPSDNFDDFEQQHMASAP